MQCSATLWNMCVDFDTLAEHSPVNLKKYAAMPSVLIQKLENRFQDCKKKKIIFFISKSIFSQHKYIPFENSQVMYRVAIKSSILSLYQNFIIPLLPERYPSLHSHAFLVPSPLGSTYICEQLFQRMKHRKSKISSIISDEHLESSLRIAATPSNQADALVSQKQGHISH